LKKPLPPNISEVAEIFKKARALFKESALHLGCMRPRGIYGQEIETISLDNGFNRIVNPSRSTIRLAKERSLEIHYGKECCYL
jgi:uncharacterized radical SAM superfamily protein